MELLKNYRPDGLEIEISSGNTVSLMVVRENPRFGIIARVKGAGRVVLWDRAEAEAHRDDTEEQFVDRVKEKLA